MKLAYRTMEHLLRFDGGCVNELVVENRNLFFEMVNNVVMQTDGSPGNFILSIADTPVDFCRYVDATVQFAPFQVNRKSLLTKLYAALEKRAVLAEHYVETTELLSELERYMLHISEELPFEIVCQKLAIGSIIRALAPEIENDEKTPLEKIFSYMELVRELDRDKLFVMINMRSYFSDESMELFAESVCLHGFKVLLLESTAAPKIQRVNRFVIDADLCEF